MPIRIHLMMDLMTFRSSELAEPCTILKVNTNLKDDNASGLSMVHVDPKNEL